MRNASFTADQLQKLRDVIREMPAEGPTFWAKTAKYRHPEVFHNKDVNAIRIKASKLHTQDMARKYEMTIAEEALRAEIDDLKAERDMLKIKAYLFDELEKITFGTARPYSMGDYFGLRLDFNAIRTWWEKNRPEKYAETIDKLRKEK